MPGEEASICWYSWSNITWVCAHLRFIVHTLCHYCRMVYSYCMLQATRFPSFWRWTDGLQGWELNIIVYSVGFLCLQLILATVSSSHGCIVLRTYSCGIRNQDTLQLWGMGSGLFLFLMWANHQFFSWAQFNTGVLVWSFKSSSRAVAQRELFDWVTQVSMVRILTS